ncbi:malonic semialdehyde reductase [Magnetospirillum sulfuroxidans]|uniref:Putative NADH dehydrogenase/NAD(P)H nitroreductase KEC16_13025 n=1 Tax=Magnetospirillum sulfuroxidans TaxID=611300 RepID=A0ABS5IDZ8_9PROT|nr:malonic semialdehyde reductase [Magnetospirillum sulfuroxidans]MBR9972640.1 malonic semialdehyde reductase [Magnetospirillum sulfuroxidans]
MTTPLLEQMFTFGRTHSYWQDRPVDPALLHQAWDMAVLGPSSANCQPMRVAFVVSPAAKEKLRPALAPGNVDKTMAAPVTAIIAQDMKFYDKLPELYPQTDARAWFAGNDGLIAATAFRNSSLQAGYFILALRALGLDCGPMSGFDAGTVDGTFFADTHWQANFLVNIGYGDATKLHPRNPRLSFAQGCAIL